MTVKFELSYVWTRERECEWWTKHSGLEKVLGALRSAGVLSPVSYAGPAGERSDWKKVSSYSDLVEQAKQWGKGRYYLASSAQKKPSFEVMLRIRPVIVEISQFIRGPLEAEQCHQLDRSIEFVEALHDTLEHSVLFGSTVRITPPFEVPSPRLRIPRSFEVLKSSSMVECFCQEYFEREARSDARDEINTLLSLDLPDWVDRRETGDLVILRWVDRFDDEEHIRDRLARRLLWLVEHLDPPVSPGVTEQGDRAANPTGRTESDSLTFYAPLVRHGYKATICREDGSVDEQLFEEMESWIEAGETGEGEELHALHLVLPSRDAALRIRERADELGIDKVLYMDNDGNLWDPFPEGDWLDEEEFEV